MAELCCNGCGSVVEYNCADSEWGNPPEDWFECNKCGRTFETTYPFKRYDSEGGGRKYKGQKAIEV